MEYILFACLAMVASAANTIFNRLSSNKVSVMLSAFLKSIFIVLAAFLICACLGHVPTLYSLSAEQWIWIAVVGVLTCFNWIFYFAAIKNSHLEAFSPFEETSQLFFSNVLFMIFTFSEVTNGGSPLNIILFSLGLVALVSALVTIILNKKINPSKKIIWIVYAAISSLALAATMLIVKLKLSDVPSDIITYHQMTIVTVVTFVGTIVNKELPSFKSLKWQDYARFFIAAVFNALLMIFRYRALSYDNCIPSIVSVIITCEFVLVSVATIIFFKANNKKAMSILISLIVTGMVLILIAGLI